MPKFIEWRSVHRQVLLWKLRHEKLPTASALQGGDRREEALGAEDKRGNTAVGKEESERLDGVNRHFKEKKIYSQFQGPGKGRGKALLWFHSQGTQEAGRLKEVETWGR